VITYCYCLGEHHNVVRKAKRALGIRALGRTHYLRQLVFVLCLTLTFDFELLQLTHLFPDVGVISAPNFVKIRGSQ